MPQVSDMQRGFRWLRQPSLALGAAFAIDEGRCRWLAVACNLDHIVPNAQRVDFSRTFVGARGCAANGDAHLAIQAALAASMLIVACSGHFFLAVASLRPGVKQALRKMVESNIRLVRSGTGRVRQGLLPREFGGMNDVPWAMALPLWAGAGVARCDTPAASRVGGLRDAVAVSVIRSSLRTGAPRGWNDAAAWLRRRVPAGNRYALPSRRA